MITIVLTNIFSPSIERILDEFLDGRFEVDNDLTTAQLDDGGLVYLFDVP
jgi:hypothetical protein